MKQKIFIGAIVFETALIIVLLFITIQINADSKTPIRHPLLLALEYESPPSKFEELLQTQRGWINFRQEGVTGELSMSVLEVCALTRRTNHIELLIKHGADVEQAITSRQANGDQASADLIHYCQKEIGAIHLQPSKSESSEKNDAAIEFWRGVIEKSKSEKAVFTAFLTLAEIGGIEGLSSADIDYNAIHDGSIEVLRTNLNEIGYTDILVKTYHYGNSGGTTHHLIMWAGDNGWKVVYKCWTVYYNSYVSIEKDKIIYRDGVSFAISNRRSKSDLRPHDGI